MGLLLAVVCLIVYASLYPWVFVFRHLNASPLWMLLHSWSGPFGRRFVSDIAVNVLLYVPFGAAAWRVGRRPVWLVCLGAAVLSGSIEMLQLYTPHRQCSGFDFLDNVLGAAVGAGAASFWSRSRRRGVSAILFTGRGDGGAAVLAAIWLASMLFPFFPVISLIAYRAEVAAFVVDVGFQPVALVTACVSWWAGMRLMRAAGLQPEWQNFVLLILPLQFLIVSRAPSFAGVLGAALGVWCDRRFRLSAFLRDREAETPVALLLLAVLVYRGLRPFIFTTFHPFVWTPFAGALASAEWQDGVRIMLEKFFLYGAAIWLLMEAAAPRWAATLGVACLLLTIEIAQMRIPGHIPEITDPVIALGFGLLRRTPR